MQYSSSVDPIQRIGRIEQSSSIRLIVIHRGQRFILNANPDDKGRVLMEQIRAARGISCMIKVQISCPGFVIGFNKDLTLRDQSLSTGSCLIIAEALCGGGFSFAPFSFNQLSNTIFKEFSNKAPSWRVVGTGLNLRGRCKKAGCDADGQIIWIRLGLGQFHIRKLISKAQCPNCHSNTKEVDNLGFIGCNYRIEGSLSESESEIPPIEGKAKKEHLTTFKDNKEKVNWDFIKVTTWSL